MGQQLEEWPMGLKWKKLSQQHASIQVYGAKIGIGIDFIFPKLPVKLPVECAASPESPKDQPGSNGELGKDVPARRRMPNSHLNFFLLVL
jgi:hypothetical protein